MKIWLHLAEILRCVTCVTFRYKHQIHRQTVLKYNIDINPTLLRLDYSLAVEHKEEYFRQNFSQLCCSLLHLLSQFKSSNWVWIEPGNVRIGCSFTSKSHQIVRQEKAGTLLRNPWEDPKGIHWYAILLVLVSFSPNSWEGWKRLIYCQHRYN